MSDFVLIVPMGWTEFTEINEQINSASISINELSSWIAQEAWDDIFNMLVGGGIDMTGKTVSNGRLIQTDTGYRFWAVIS